MKKAILISGGLESIAMTYHKKPEYGITIDYGQVCANAEIKASKQVCKELNIKHILINFGSKNFEIGELFGSSKISSSMFPDWVPFRNQLILTIGCIKALEIGVDILLIGTVKDDDIYKDGTKRFYQLFNDLLVYQEGNIKVKAPAIDIDSEQFIIESEVPLSLLSWGHSCTRGNYACGKCRSCKKHNRIMSKFDGK